ncbi:MAG: NIPSNAP family protein [Gammaproteobacteria bacterium]|uniref:NIPSNAP family protein n=1 Tax=OM182 bacterium MED-G28 TaxID=1986256 RepID=A0A2A5WDH0_9GAMM|nr:NIPSNAP family protein [Gammaproteobacteria bacterium]PDH34186.1 MAG: NIPSNAP family protein [OM182 bacterium MED-G28]
MNKSIYSENNVNKLIKTSAISLVSLAIGLGAGIFFSSAAQDEKVFELRTYTATPGNLDNLHARFRDHTTRIFRKHGMEVVGYWSPTSEEEREDTLVYLLAHDNQDAANASWQAFIADSEWATVAEESNRNGQILGGIEAKFMVATDYSPMK